MTAAFRLLTLAATFAEILLRAMADGLSMFAESVTAQQIEADDCLPESMTQDVIWP